MSAVRSPHQILEQIHASLEEPEALSTSCNAFLRESLARHLSPEKPCELERAFGLTPTRRGRSARKPRVVGMPRWSENGVINDSGIRQVIAELNSGDAHPTDVGATLAAIHSALPVLTRSMRRYLLVAIGRSFQADLTLEQAFGLKRSATGRPGPPIERRQAIAGFVLLKCLEPPYQFSLRDAATVVGTEHGMSTTQVLECWRKHRLEAIHFVKEEKSKSRPGPKEGLPWKWNSKETRVLESLFARSSAKIARLWK